MTITIADGRGALWQWDTGRRCKITDGDGVKQVHYQNKCFGRSVDVDVGTDGTAIIPDELLQDWHTLTAYAYVTDDAGAYTMVQQDFAVHKRAKPAGYVYTPTDQMTLQTIQRQIGDLSDLSTAAKENLVAAINEVARTGGGGSMDLRVADGYIQYSTDGGSTWQNLIAVADLKGADGAPGKDGVDGKPGAAGADGITPHIGDNGNWYLGSTDTGKPSRGATGAKGDAGAPGKDGAGMDITGATVGQIAKITTVDASGVPTAWEPVDMPAGGGGRVFGTYDYTVLASGTIPAGTVTALGLGSSYFDTGVTVGDLRGYRVWACYYRCDAGDQYYGFALASSVLNRRLIYSALNAQQIVAIWADDDGQTVIPIGGAANVYCTDPLDAANIGGLVVRPMISNGGGVAIGSFGAFVGAADSDHIYVGIFHMNSKETNAKDMRWAITGVVKK